MREALIKRYDRYGPIRLMVEYRGYLMVRRPHAVPFVLSDEDWNKLAAEPNGASKIEVSRGRVTIHNY